MKKLTCNLLIFSLLFINAPCCLAAKTQKINNKIEVSTTKNKDNNLENINFSNEQLEVIQKLLNSQQNLLKKQSKFQLLKNMFKCFILMINSTVFVGVLSLGWKAFSTYKSKPELKELIDNICQKVKQSDLLEHVNKDTILKFMQTILPLVVASGSTNNMYALVNTVMKQISEETTLTNGKIDLLTEFQKTNAEVAMTQLIKQISILFGTVQQQLPLVVDVLKTNTENGNFNEIMKATEQLIRELTRYVNNINQKSS